MSTATKTRPRRTTKLTEEELEAKREAREQKISALKESLDTAILGLMNDPKQWVEFLETVSDFAAQYSMGNQLLIWMEAQRRGFSPTMTLPVGDLTTLHKGGKARAGWAKLGRWPVKGEKGLPIFRPTFRRYTDEDVERLSSAQRARVRRDAQGRWPERLVGWQVEYVFDISQTDGADVELPPSVTVRRRVRAAGASLPVLLTGEDTTGSLAKVVAQVEKLGYVYSRVTHAALNGANGRTSGTRKTVQVRDDVDDAQAMKTSVHEWAHILCGHVDDDFDYVAHRGHAETEAESVAYIVCGALGMDTGQYSAPYVATWADKPEVVEQAAKNVVKVSKAILAALVPAEEAV